MASNNYFGFTHGGTQYGANNPTYQTGQAGYPVTPSTPAPSYTTQRPQTGYETTYQTPTTHTNPANYTVGTATTAAPSTYDYGYGRAAQPNYETTKTYYQQPTTAATPSYSTTETHYQATTKPVFNTSTYTPPTRQTSTPKPNNYTTAYSTQASSYTTGYTPSSSVQATNSTKASQSNTNYSTYDPSVYNTTPMYVTPQAQSTSAITGTVNKTSNTWKGFKNGSITTSTTGMMKQLKQKPPQKSQQLHYCDVCKISCAGPQTYREHLDGQKHKKKESAQKAGSAPVSRGGNALRCELCDVTCTGTDAYLAHIRGAKHQKVLKLHTKLGKPIPSTDPVLLGNNKSSSTSVGSNPIKTLVGTAIKTVSSSPSISGSALKKAIPNVPKVNFVSAGSLGTVGLTGNGAPEIKQEFISVKEEINTENDAITDKDIQPVGQNYIEEIKNEDGKIISFNCKLCECRFNDPNAKEMHMKGRRHRLQYKKKVNPDLVVDVKPSLRQRKLQEEKLRRQQLRDEYWRRRDEERIMEEEERMYWEERRRYEEEYEYEWYRRYGRDPRSMTHPSRPFGPPSVPPLMFFPQPMRRPDSSDDRHVIARHAEIYPKEEELQAVQKIVSHTEKALKFVSDFLTDSALSANPKTDLNTSNTTVSSKQNTPVQTIIIPSSGTAASSSLNIKQEIKEEVDNKKQVKEENKKEDGRDGQLFSFQRDKDDQFPPILKGVMRVGVLAKGLLLHGDTNVNLVVLCGEKPTRTLLNRVADNIPKQLKVVAPNEQYKVHRNIDEASISVSGMTETNKITVNITLTSPIMREQILCSGKDAASSEFLGDSVNVSQATMKEPVDVLDKQKCLDALAALRHAKWFQARATGLQSCVMVIRILRDLCQRVPTWSPLESWAMELLVEKVISSAGQPLTPGDALRRVMEALASGILLDGGPGIHDPCEKDPSDPTSSLTPQKREDITASAQHALRLIVFRQIYKVLGMEPLPPMKFPRGRFNRKRRRDNSIGEGNDSEAGDGKKDKKDDESSKMETEK